MHRKLRMAEQQWPLIELTATTQAIKTYEAQLVSRKSKNISARRAETGATNCTRALHDIQQSTA